MTLSFLVACMWFSPPAFAAYSASMGWPYDIVLEDMNKDGNLDAVIVNRTSDSLQVQLGDGLGNFGTSKFFPIGSSPRALAIGDLNGDGNLDVVTANQFSNDISVLHGDGAGSFSLVQTKSFGGFSTGPSCISIGDMNSDGILDVVVGNVTSDTITIIAGLSTGLLGAGKHLNFLKIAATVQGVRSVALGDINNDSKLDIVIANKASNNVLTMLGDGAGGVIVSGAIDVGQRPKAVGLADLNKDGNLDIVVANAWSNNATFLYGTGSGKYGVPQTIAVGTSPIDGAFADWNNDGLLDGVIVNESSNNVTVVYSDGTTQSIGVGSKPTAIATGDLNGDGLTDFVVTNGLGNDLTIGISSMPQASIIATKDSKKSGCVTYAAGSLLPMLLLFGLVACFFGRVERALKKIT
ncbi:MAG: VCBS repeat-containing protein [Ghiorsea sp.]